tara:strand:+ start:365 stop:532 length:168 start_codon:yes stop_codon:yes gene_type:complete
VYALFGDERMSEEKLKELKETIIGWLLGEPIHPMAIHLLSIVLQSIDDILMNEEE